MNRSVAILRPELERLIAGYGSVAVGFPAGADSSVVAAAHAALGPLALAVTAVTETITGEDIDLAGRIAYRLGMCYEPIGYNELGIAGYAENPADRCYYRKDALYSRLIPRDPSHGSPDDAGGRADRRISTVGFFPGSSATNYELVSAI